MEELKYNLHFLRSLRSLVEAKNEFYFNHMIINEKEVTDKTISIVMTAHERSRQLYFTLETMNRCTYKDVQVIIVDDSTNDKVSEQRLRDFGLHIELISIKRENKYWANPCVNYNIGFQYIRGGKVIIQNSEVCYVGNVLNYVNDTCTIDNNYYVFDVKACANFKSNEIIYSKSELNKSVYVENIYQMWYQHYIGRNKLYHFLTAMTRNTFDMIKDFSYDYSFGSAYDDDDFVVKIRSKDIKFMAIRNDFENVGGIHLFHGYTQNISNNDAYTKPTNEDLFLKKNQYYNLTGIYLDITDGEEYNIITDRFNMLNDIPIDHLKEK